MSHSTYSISLVNRKDGSVDGHKAGCADVARIVKKERVDEAWTAEFLSKRDAFLEYNSDFIAEADGDESNTYQINWLPCSKHIPDTHEVETPEPTVTAKVGAKWTYLYGPDGSLIAELRNDQFQAIATFLK